MYQKVRETVGFIASVINGFQPKLGIILGTGLGNLAQEIKINFTIDYNKIPHFPISTVEGHAGKLIFGTLDGVAVVAMSGRFHYYEGYSMEEVTFPVRVLKLLNIERLILSNAAGGLQDHLYPGDLVFLKDHINLQPENPLRGANDERFGPRFPDMLKTYDKELNARALEIASENGTRAFTGVYVGIQGPNLETPAEYRFFNTIGGDAVGMSTVPEVLVARHMGLPVFVVSVISNRCFPIEELEETTLEEVLQVVQQTEPKVTKIIRTLIQEL